MFFAKLKETSLAALVRSSCEASGRAEWKPNALNWQSIRLNFWILNSCILNSCIPKRNSPLSLYLYTQTCKKKFFCHRAFGELSTVIYIYPGFPCFPSAKRSLVCEVKKASLQHKQALFAVQGSLLLKAGEAGGGNPHVPSPSRQTGALSTGTPSTMPWKHIYTCLIHIFLHHYRW